MREARQGYVSLALDAMHSAADGGLKDMDDMYEAATADGTQVSHAFILASRLR